MKQRILLTSQLLPFASLGAADRPVIDLWPEGRLFALNVVARLPRAFPAERRPMLKRLAASPGTGAMDNYLGRAAEDLVRNPR